MIASFIAGFLLGMLSVTVLAMVLHRDDDNTVDD